MGISSVAEAIEDIKAGKLLIIVDDEKHCREVMEHLLLCQTFFQDGSSLVLIIHGSKRVTRPGNTV